MKRLLIVATLCLICITGLVSCDNSAGVTVPEDMQIVKNSVDEGYIFFGPEGWVIANQGKISSTYLSSFNPVSITFTSLDMPSDRNEAGEIDLVAYFDRTASVFPYGITVSKRGEACNFGASDACADKAYKFVYSYTVEGELYSCMQVMAIRGDDLFVLTFTAPGGVEDENSSYRVHLEKAQAAIDNLRFTDKAPAANEAPVYEKDEDGYILVSDKVLCGFDLYLPDDYAVIDASGIVSAKISDGASIIISRAAETGKSVLDYLLDRRADVVAIADPGSFVDVGMTVAAPVNTDGEYFKQTDENGNLKWTASVLPSTDTGLRFGNIANGKVAAYEYRYSHGGNDYHVYQILGADSFNGYVFTYTALEGEYNNHIDEIKTILAKVTFR